jgi:predicted GNAT family acetyltransferase
MIVIRNNAAAQRYEAFLNGGQAGVCHYKLEGKTITFSHTVVDPAFEGKGVGSALARYVLDESRSGGLRVVPACKFIAAYISRHSEYRDLVQ